MSLNKGELYPKILFSLVPSLTIIVTVFITNIAVNISLKYNGTFFS